MAANVKRKQTIVLSLCKRLSLDPKPFLGDVAEPEIDVNTLCSQIFKSSGAQLQKNNDQVLKWIAFVESFPTDSKACLDSLNELNADLGHKTVILGSGFTPSEADVIVFSALHPSVIGLSISDKEKFPHLMRWMDYIQNKEGLDEFFEKILLEKPDFAPQLQGEKSTAKEELYPNVRNTIKNTKSADKSEADPNIKKSDAGKKAIGDEVAVQDKKKLPVAEAVDKDKEVSISLLNIQVGLICKAWKHPSADSLLVEEIDVGEAKLRQVVSGLAKYCSPDQLTNRHVVLITNVKPGKLRDVMSEGLVLCASNEDHSVVEPLLPPEGAKLGEHISFSGIDGRPEDILNPKKKQLEKITPHLFTDDKGVAMFKGIPFMTSAGPCTSSIPRASIK